MKKIGRPNRIVMAGSLLLLGCFLIIFGRWRGQSGRPLLFVTTLPFQAAEYATQSIAVVDPMKQTCAPVTYLDRTITDVAQLRWSPRRDEIVYSTYAMEDKSTSLWVMKADGSGRQPILLRAPAELNGANLSPDGRFVAFIKPIQPKEPETAEAWVWDRQDGSTHQVMTGTVQAEWSPRENVMLVYRWTNGRSYLVRADGTIADDLGPVGEGGVWSPDGRRIAYTSDTWVGDASSGHRDFVYEVYILDLATKQRQQVSHANGQYTQRFIDYLSWSPDGKRMAYKAHIAGSASGDRYRVLFVLNVESGREIELADHVSWSDPVWSPDSQQLVFVSTKDETTYGQIYRVDIDSGATVQITCDDELKTSLSW